MLSRPRSLACPAMRASETSPRSHASHNPETAWHVRVREVLCSLRQAKE